jgi:hypothetical protein
MNTFLSLTYEHFEFKDTCTILSSPLDTLAENLLKSGEDKFAYTRRHTPNYDTFKLFLRKGVLPYDYFDSFSKLTETELPAREQFYNKLYERECSEEDYRFAQTCWETLGCENLQDYMEFYLRVDTMILTDVFITFCDITFKIYGLDPARFVSISQLAYQAALKYTGVELEAITDPDIWDMFRTGVRGGMSGVAQK